MDNTAYQKKRTTDWRAALAKNQRRTILVMASFIFIYLFMGFLIDLYVHGAFIENNFLIVANNLLTLQIPPLATLTMGLVAIIAIFITFSLHDRIILLGTNYHEITGENANNLQETQLYNVVEELKIAAGLRYMPKLYLIEADYMNAFASGYSEKSAMIAITRGLLEKLDREELQAVMAHELSHIRHGDIKLTLMTSVLANIMLIVIDIFFYNLIFSGRRDREGNNWFVVIIILLRYLLPFITVLLMLSLSRTREYMADAGSVELMRDNHPIAKALLKISGDYDQRYETYQKDYTQTQHEDVRRAAYIFDPFHSGKHSVRTMTSLFSTHPSIMERLQALGFNSEKEV